MGIFDFFRKGKKGSANRSPKKTDAPFSEIIGELHASWLDEDIYFSNPHEIPLFDNAMIAIGIGAADHKETLEKADNALGNFTNLTAKDRLANSQKVLNYYQKCLTYGICKELDIQADSDVWNYVVPAEIIVESISGEGTLVMVNCECEWEQEHGLMLTFKNGKDLREVGGIE